MAKSSQTTSKFILPLLVLFGGVGIGSTVPLMLARYSIFIVVALPVTLLSLWLMHQTVRVFFIRRLTIPGFWYLSYLVMIFIPAFYVAANKPDSLAKYNYLFAVGSVLLTAPLGILTVNIIFHFKPVEIKYYFEAPVRKRTTSSHLVIAFLIFLLGALGLTFLYVIEVRKIPLFYLLANIGAFEEALQLRETSFKLLSSWFTYAYAVLRQMGYPFLIMLALGSYLTTRRLSWLLLFIITFISGTLYASFSLAKAPVAIIFLTSSIFLYLYFGGAIKTQWLILGLILVLSFPVIVNLLLYPWVGLTGVLQVTALRLLDDPARQLYSYFEVVPQHLDYLHGITIGIVARLQGQVPFNLANYVALYDNPTLRERGLTSALANAAFIGDMHANFGVGGVLVGGFLAGFLMQLIQIHLLRQPKTTLNMTIYAYVLLGFWWINLIALPTALLSNGIIFAIVLALAIRISESFLKQSVSISSGRSHSQVTDCR